MKNYRNKEFNDFLRGIINDEDVQSELISILAMDIDSMPIENYLYNKMTDMLNAIIFELVDEDITLKFNQAYDDKDYSKCFELMMYVFKHYYIAITVAWKEYPKKLSRHLLIPYRNSLGDVIYATLAAFRTDSYHFVELSANGMTFKPLIEEEYFSDEDKFADLFPAFMLYSFKNTKIIYDYGEGWEFVVRTRKPMLVLDDMCEDNVIIQKGIGYGIFEDNRGELENFLDNPNGVSLFDENMKAKDVIPFDFEDANIEELKEEIEGLFLVSRMNYTCIEEDSSDLDEIDTNVIM